MTLMLMRDVSLLFRRAWLALFVAGAALLVLPACGPENVGKDVSEPYEAPPPRHPAMNAPVSVSRSQGGPTSAGALPPGHPPIGGSTRGSMSPSASSTPVQPTGGPVAIAGVTFPIPESFHPEPPANRMRAAQFALPHAEGDAVDAELTFSLAGGDLEGNVARWEGFFEGSPKAEVEKTEIGGKSVAFVTIRGTLKDGFRDVPGPLADFVQYTAIVQAPQGQVFVKALGPARTLELHKEALDAMVRGLE